MTKKIANETRWPALPLEEWEPTYKTLHRWSQIVGKVQLALSPPVNHWWHATLRFGSRGLETLPMMYEGRQLQIAFDFVDHRILFTTSDGMQRDFALESFSVAEFYKRVRNILSEIGINVQIWTMPVEIANPVRFTEDHANATYDREAVQRMWTILQNVYQAFSSARNEFIGKQSPVHFFWGGFDVAWTRFSGRRNPNAPTDPIMSEAYSHEVISHGFWFGGDWPMGGRVNAPIFYSYAVPEPKGFADARIQPSAAYYSKDFGEYILPYDNVRTSEDPRAEVLAFIRATYEAGATLGHWDRESLERHG